MMLVERHAAIHGEVRYDEKPRRDLAVDIVVHHQRPTPIASARHVPFLSLISDLSIGEHAIAEQFSMEFRRKIRRAQGKDALRFEVITDYGQRSPVPSPARCLATARATGRLQAPSCRLGSAFAYPRFTALRSRSCPCGTRSLLRKAFYGPRRPQAWPVWTIGREVTRRFVSCSAARLAEQTKISPIVRDAGWVEPAANPDAGSLDEKGITMRCQSGSHPETTIPGLTPTGPAGASGVACRMHSCFLRNE